MYMTLAVTPFVTAKYFKQYASHVALRYTCILTTGVLKSYLLPRELADGLLLLFSDRVTLLHLLRHLLL